MLVGKKTCRLKKKCRLENFPCQKRTCPECPEFLVMQDQERAEAGGKRPRAYRGKTRGKNRHLEKKLSVEKQNVGWRISPPKNGHVGSVRNSLEENPENGQRREKNPLRPIGRGKKNWDFFLSVGQKKIPLEKKMPAVQNDWA